jgi:hypothetical protein
MGRRRHLEWKARRLLQATGLAIEASEEGGPGGWLRGEVEVVIDELAPLHEHERALLVWSQLLGGEAHDGVGDCTSLRDKERQGSPGSPRLPQLGLAPSARWCSPGAQESRRV